MRARDLYTGTHSRLRMDETERKLVEHVAHCRKRYEDYGHCHGDRVALDRAMDSLRIYRACPEQFNERRGR